MPLILHILHVVGAVFIVGPMAILPMSGLRAMRSGTATQVALLARSTMVFSLLSILVAVVGFGVMSTAGPDDNWTITTPWILWSIVLYTLAAVASLAIVVPAMRRAAGASAPSTDQRLPGYRPVAIGSGITTLLLLAVVVLMVWKP